MQRVAVVFVPGTDCNSNGVVDEEDIANGTSPDCNENGIPDECDADIDDDGFIDDCDACPDSISGDTIFIDGCETGVVNMTLFDGCTMADEIAHCAEVAVNHGSFVSCVAHLSNQWKHDGLVGGFEKGRIQRCAARADVPPS